MTTVVGIFSQIENFCSCFLVKIDLMRVGLTVVDDYYSCIFLWWYIGSLFSVDSMRVIHWLVSLQELW